MTGFANLFATTLRVGAAGGEQVEILAGAGGARVERIASPPGHSSPDGFWYDQPHAEWVAVLAGSAGLLFERDAEPRRLGPGDHVLIPARSRHRVAWTDPDVPTVWLAVHLPTWSAPQLA